MCFVSKGCFVEVLRLSVGPAGAGYSPRLHVPVDTICSEGPADCVLPSGFFACRGCTVPGVGVGVGLGWLLKAVTARLGKDPEEHPAAPRSSAGFPKPSRQFWGWLFPCLRTPHATLQLLMDCF